MASQISVDRESYPGITVVHAQQSRYIDAPQVNKLGEELFALVEGKTNPRLIISMQNVVFLASTVFNKLIILDKKCKAADGQWRICDLRPDIMKVFVITRLNYWFTIDPDLATAVKKFATLAPA